jgi:hypothetical protein
MKSSTVALLAIIGGVVGVAVVRMFMLNYFQIVGWNLFWKNLSHFNFDMIKLVFKSATFGKCFLGFIIGAVAGGVLGAMVSKR